jgi:DNA-binding response OmpR family regulator
MPTDIKIAIVEDDLPIANMYKIKLESAGFQTVLAHDGKQGLEVIKKHLPQLV